MKKRILFCIENFQHGGINRALENLLTLIDASECEVNLFVVNHEDGPYKEQFAQYLRYRDDSLLTSLCVNYRRYSGIKKYSLLGIKVLRKIALRFGYDPFSERLEYWANKIASDKFDYVIAYAEGYITEFVSKIPGRKIAWIHIDYQRYLVYTHNPEEREIYSKFNHVVIPSKFAANSFSEVFPEFKDKVQVMPNSIDSKKILDKSNDSIRDERFHTDCFTIVSVGRICYEKRFLEIPEIAVKLRQLGMKFRWYIIGDGSVPETAAMNAEIYNNQVQDVVIPLGRKDNPYPYIRKSQLLVSTSLSETFSYVIFEAKLLGIPVVSADFGTAPEVLLPQEGIISPMNKMAAAIYRIYSDRKLYSAFRNHLFDYSYDNQSIQQQLSALLQ